jgi:hypothetical protein
VLRDTNVRRDAYEWSDGEVELISSGQDRSDSGLLTVSADGVDAYFFTRETLAPNDTNGTLMKVYDAREEGGFFRIPPPPGCAASDECHGAGSQAPEPIVTGTLEGSGGNVPAQKPCKKGKVRRNGKCVPRKKRRIQHRHSTRRNG